MQITVRLCKPGPRGRVREWARLGVDPLCWLRGNRKLGEVCSNLTKCTSPNRLLLSNQNKGSTLVLLILLLLHMALVCSTSLVCIFSKVIFCSNMLWIHFNLKVIMIKISILHMWWCTFSSYKDAKMKNISIKEICHSGRVVTNIIS